MYECMKYSMSERADPQEADYHKMSSSVRRLRTLPWRGWKWGQCDASSQWPPLGALHSSGPPITPQPPLPHLEIRQATGINLRIGYLFFWSNSCE